MSSVKTREAYEMQVASFEKEHAEFANSETKIDAMMEQLNEAVAIMKQEEAVVVKKAAAIAAAQEQQRLVHAFSAQLAEFQQFTRAFMLYPDMFLHGPACLRPTRSP